MAVDGMAIFAHYQTEGKGRMGKKWEGEKQANMALSILIKPDFLSLSRQFMLSACIAVSVHQLLEKYVGEGLKIKWPNDLYWQDRKAGGILIESVVGAMDTDKGKWQWAIAGIGINVNQKTFPEWLLNPVSIFQITGKMTDTVSLARDCCAKVEQNLKLLKQNGFETIFNYYNRVLYKRGAVVKFKKGTRVFEAEVKRIDESGRLIIHHATEETLEMDELEWVIK